jgi:phage baseplate assembly protein V
MMRIWMAIRELRQELRAIRNRLLLSAARGAVRLANDSTGLQTLQLGLLNGEVRDNCEHLQGYGLTAVPTAGAEAVVIFPGGSRDHPIIVGVADKRYRPGNLGGGEVCLYSQFKQQIYLKADGSTQITTGIAGQQISLNADGSVQILAPGEIKLTSQYGQTIWMRSNQNLEFDVPNSQVMVNTKTVVINGNLIVTGTITS